MKAVLNTLIEEDVMKRVKIKAAQLDLTIPNFVNRVLDLNTQNIFVDEKVTKLTDKVITKK